MQQNPLSALNPRRTIGASLRLALDVHDIGPKAERAARIGALLQEVGLEPDYARRYPAALSGGQRQRVAIARALACESELVVLDEPTSALDASIQAEILNLLEQVRKDRGLTFVMVSHDLAVISHMCEHLAVMKSGKIVETLSVEQLRDGDFSTDYTRQLMTASEGFRRV